MKKDWIQNVLNSGKKIEDSEVNPFLFSKIMNKVQQRLDFLHQPVQASLSWGMLATFLVLIFLNIVYFSFQPMETEEEINTTVSVSEDTYDVLVTEYLEQEENDYAILTNY